jgi:hypothetical protein
LSFSEPTRALLAFHRGAGLRVALRASIVGVCLILFVGGSSPDLAYTIYRFVLGVASTAAGPDALQFLVLLALGLATRAEARIRVGVKGWLLTLPASGTDHRRALWGALVLAQLPVLATGVLCALVAALGYREPLSPAKLLGLPLGVAGVAAAAVPSTRGVFARPVALAAALLATIAAWWGITASVALLVVADRAAGPIRLRRSRPRRRLFPAATGLLLAWRALSPRALLEAAVPTLLPLAGAYLFRANNQLAPATEALAARIGVGVAAAVYVAMLANALLLRRYAWPWVRSLPWSALRRAGTDAAALGLPGAWILLAAARLDPFAVPTAALVLVLAACLGAGAVRAAQERKTGAAGEVMLVGIPAAVLLGIYPVAWPLALAAAAGALALARRRDLAQRPTRWTELNHAASGDSAWLGAS